MRGRSALGDPLGYRLGSLGGAGTAFELGVDAQRRERPLQGGTVTARAPRWAGNTHAHLEVRAGPVPRLLDVLLHPGQTCANKAASVL